MGEGIQVAKWPNGQMVKWEDCDVGEWWWGWRVGMLWMRSLLLRRFVGLFGQWMPR
jgi:hypothetical protein